MTDWLSLALHDEEGQVRTASTNRALIAVKHRTEQRFARYMKASKSVTEAKARLGAIEDELRRMTNDIAVEYSAPEPDKLYQAAIKLAYGMGAPAQPGAGGTTCPSCGMPLQPGQQCPHCSMQSQEPQAGGGMRNSLMPTAAEVPADGYDSRNADPDSIIGDTPASSSGESFKGEKTLDAVREKSKNHPSETQDVTDEGDWRDNQSGHTSDPNPPKIERKMETEDLGGKNPHPEQKGTDQGGDTFGDSHGVTDPVTPGTVMARWHILER